MPSRRAAIIVAAGTLAAAVPAGAAALADTPDDLPAGAWAPSCAGPESVYCIESATIVPVSGSSTALTGEGLIASAATVSDDSGDWVRWSVDGFAGKTAAVTGGTIRLVIRTGTFVPRFTNAVADGFRAARTVSDGRYALALIGRAAPVAWTGDADCAAGFSCGDTDTTADPAEHRFEGRTQDLEGSAGSYTTALDGAYLATDAQARADLLTYDPEGQPPISLGVLGNPHLDANGEAVRNFVTLFLPGAYFAAASTDPTTAVATGFDLVTSGEAAVHQRLTATVSDGGVRIEAPDVGLGADLASAALHRRASPATPGATAPGPPQAVTVTGGTGTATVRWRAPLSNGGSPVTGYRIRAYSASSGGSVVASCETAATGCTIADLVADSVYHVAVSAVNQFGESAPAARAEVLAAVTATPAPPDPGPPLMNPGPAPTLPTPPASPTPTASPTPPASPAPSRSPSTPASPTPTPPASAQPAPPSAPRAVRLTPGVRAITVTWDDPESDGGSPITGHVVRAFRVATGGSAVAGCQATGGTNSCVLTGLTGGDRFYVAVAAVNSAGRGPDQGIRPAATAWGVAGKPRSVSAKSSGNRITVTWKAPATTGGAAITGYRAEVSGGGGPSRCTVPATGRTCSVKGLKAGRTVTVRVLAVNAAGVSAPSAAVKVKVRG
ncbi:fibronectin type III domain-containing protein [Actinoplanes sp. NEAU-A12]|uniref:Fibronectin type III domain-containing protein n=1 Tax=Actinoplanes sandaracinus TaxID=3045177 RepID=A0ABT6WR62_9ACTN|nr:fibronectin type III domain-containing protein [Actinoplanes sandaracinus]MDI6102227.1 fibronectin type III domain-containing protein [Actinoplanes sandaracinus]